MENKIEGSNILENIIPNPSVDCDGYCLKDEIDTFLKWEINNDRT